jgi:hypothetical protein
VKKLLCRGLLYRPFNDLVVTLDLRFIVLGWSRPNLLKKLGFSVHPNSVTATNGDPSNHIERFLSYLLTVQSKARELS